MGVLATKQQQLAKVQVILAENPIVIAPVEVIDRKRGPTSDIRMSKAKADCRRLLFDHIERRATHAPWK